MSYSPPSTRAGEASSPPEIGTPNTYYSPEITRNANGNVRVRRSSVAVGKQPVVAVVAPAIPPVVVSSEQTTSLKPASRSQAKFLNEVDREHEDFISRYLSVLQYPDTTVAGYDQEVELHDIQARMKEVSVLLILLFLFPLHFISTSSLTWNDHTSLRSPPSCLLLLITTHIHLLLNFADLLQYLTFSSCVPLYSRGVHMRFDNLRDSCEAKYLLECLGYLIEYITPYEFAVAKSQDTATVSDYEGQVNFPMLVQPIGNLNRKGLNKVAGFVHDFASCYGVVRDVEHAATDEKNGIIRFRVEFMSIDAANRAIQGIKEFPLYSSDNTAQVGALIYLIHSAMLTSL
jgi:hypothetical protein